MQDIHTPLVNLDDDFEYTISPRFEALIDVPFTNLREKIYLPISSLPGIPFEISISRDIIDNVLIKLAPAIHFAQPYDFEQGKEYEADDSTNIDK